MIGLRILHLATSLHAAKAGDALTAIEWLKQHGHEVAFAAGGDEDIPGVTMLRFRTGAASWWLGGKRALIEQVVEWRPDVVHLHGREAMAAARAIAKEIEVPVLMSIDAALPPAKSKDLHDAAISWVLVPTEAHRAHYVGRVKLGQDNVAQLPFSFNYEGLIGDSMREAHDAGDPPVIGLFADPNDKAVTAILNELDTLAAQGVAFSCIIAYRNPDDEESIRESYLQDVKRPWIQIKCCEHIGLILPQIDIMVHPCGERRAAPIIAAMGTGRTVIACANLGIEELIKNDETGIVIPCNDHNALRTALINVLSDSALRKRFGEAAQADAKNRFEINVVGPALVELYRNAISALHRPEGKVDGSRAYRRQITQ
jgi:hypothetical protein